MNHDTDYRDTISIGLCRREWDARMLCVCIQPNFIEWRDTNFERRFSGFSGFALWATFIRPKLRIQIGSQLHQPLKLKRRQTDYFTRSCVCARASVCMAADNGRAWCQCYYTRWFCCFLFIALCTLCCYYKCGMQRASNERIQNALHSAPWPIRQFGTGKRERLM